jgi:hypothetical protein
MNPTALSPDQLLAASIAEKERASAEAVAARAAQGARVSEASRLALRAVYEAAAAGNVRCREAVAEIERLLPPAVQTPAPSLSPPATQPKPKHTMKPKPRRAFRACFTSIATPAFALNLAGLIDFAP